MNKSKLRQANLSRVIDQRTGGNTSAFCKMHDLDPGYIWQILNDRRSFGERSARNIEQKAGLATGELDAETSCPPPPNQVNFGLISLPPPTVIPVRSFVQILNNEQGSDTMMVFGEFSTGVFGYRLETDQMQGLRGEYIRIGSMLTIDPDAAPAMGDVVLAEVGGDPVIGHYVRHAGAVKLRPSNEQYDVTDISNGKILGVVKQWAYAPT